MSRVELVH